MKLYFYAFFFTDPKLPLKSRRFKTYPEARDYLKYGRLSKKIIWIAITHTTKRSNYQAALLTRNQKYKTSEIRRFIRLAYS